LYTDPGLGRVPVVASAMRTRLLGLLILFSPLVLAAQTAQTPAEQARMDEQNAQLRALLAGATRLPHEPRALAVTPPSTPGWAMGMVSWVASSKDGLVYLLQRGDAADPVVVVDTNGRVVRSWGKGLYSTPHAIRLDPQGNVWTTDAANSMVYKFSPDGTVLLKIEVGGQPSPCNNFCSTTDIAFASDGHLFIADGYRNARVLEYTADGRKVREWGKAGTGPGEFRLPHSIQIDERGIVYVADRENGRIQRFDRQGTFLGEWTQYGKTFGLTLVGNALWLSTIPRGPNTAPGWLLQVNRDTGALSGFVESQGNHGVDVTVGGDLLLAPGPSQIPQRYRRAR
jgi:DNA-binding beta-propeller fold protein YncE